LNSQADPTESNSRLRRVAERIFYVLFAAWFVGMIVLSVTGHNKNSLGTFSEEGTKEIKAAVQSICAELDRTNVGRCGALTWHGKHGWFARVEVHEATGKAASNITQVAKDLGWTHVMTSSGSLRHTKDSLHLSLNLSPGGTTYLIIRSTK
jgi:hypothetical protein